MKGHKVMRGLPPPADSKPGPREMKSGALTTRPLLLFLGTKDNASDT